MRRMIRTIGASCVVVLLAAFTSPKTGCGTYTKTQYPIVLAHGAAGFDSLFGVLDYWFGIPEDLASGGARVFVTEVSQLNSPEVRGEQLIEQLDEIRAITGKAKMNLIGHSQGGLDVRYVAAVRPDLVASVTTVGTPHQGAQIADTLAAGFLNGGFTQDLLNTLGNALGTVIGLLSGHSDPQDASAGLQSLTTAAAASFNAAYPAGLPTTPCGSGPSVVNGIRFYSWTGTGVLTNSADPFDDALGVASLFTSEANDGLVGRCGAHLGQVLRDDYFMNHLDEVNQITALVSLFEVNPLVVFRTHGNRLKTAGL